MDLFEAILFAITNLTVLTQLYVIALIYTVSPASMKDYRYFLFSYTFWDMMFTISIGYILMPVLYYPAPYALVDGLARLLGPNGGRIALSFSVFAGASLFTAMDYCLMFRFTVIQTNKMIHYYFLKPAVMFAFHVFAWSLQAVAAVLVYTALSPPEEVPSVLARQFPEYLWTLSTPGVVPLYLDCEEAYSRFVCATIIGCLTTCELVSFATVFGILRTLGKNSSSYTAKTYKMHRRLTLLLLAQLSTPMIFVALPLVAMLVSVIEGVQVTTTSVELGIVLLALYAMSNSLLTVTFIAPYRRFTASLFERVWRFTEQRIRGRRRQIEVNVLVEPIATAASRTINAISLISVDRLNA